MASDIVLSIGATCFGITAGYITHRTLLRQSKGAQVSDIAAVLAAVGGGAVTALLPTGGGSDGFGWYSIGLLGGMIIYFANFRLHNGKKATAEILGEGAPPRTMGR